MAAMMGGGGKSPMPQQNKKPVDPITAKSNALRLTAFNNMSMVYLKMSKWQEAREKCDLVLKRDAKNTKALFRRGIALRHLNSFELARADFVAAQKILDPTKDPAIEREMKLLAKDEKKAENAFYKQMKKQMKRGQKKAKKKTEKATEP